LTICRINNFTPTIIPPLISIGDNPVGDVSDMEDGKVFARGHSLWVKLNNSTVKRITNFIVEFKGIIIEEDLHRKKCNFFLICAQNDTKKITLKIPVERVINLKQEIERQSPCFYIDTTTVQKAPEYFKKHISELIAESDGQLEMRLVYTYPGWNLTQNRNMHYYSALDPDCKSDRNLADLAHIPTLTQNAADKFAFGVLGWGELRVMMPVLLHSVSGFLYRLFKEAGRPIQYILNLCGPTGIGKTLLLRLLCRPFDPERRMPNFTGTQKGIELFCEQNHDSMAVIDDLSSMTDTKAKKLLESVERQYCDGNGRAYSSNGGKDLIIADTSFGLCISSETPLEGVRQSSQVRILTLEMTVDSLTDLSSIKTELSSNSASWQNRINLLDIFFTKFILTYVEPNYNDIVRFIASYEPPRLQFSVEFRRFYEAYRILAAIAHILLKYFVDRQIVLENNAPEIFTLWIKVLQDLIKDNECLGQESDPAKVFLDTVKQGLAQNIIAIASSKKDYEISPGEYMGFWSDGERKKLVLDPTNIFSWFARRIESLRLKIQITHQEMWRKLLTLGISQGYNEKNRKSPRPLYPVSINKKKINMLVLYSDKLD